MLYKFASDKTPGNKWGIMNSTDEVVTVEYLRRYIHCWNRIQDGFVHDRKHNIAYFLSDAFLLTCGGLTASQVGQKARFSPLWKRPVDGLTNAEAVAGWALRVKAGIEEFETMRTAAAAAAAAEKVHPMWDEDSGVMPEYATVEAAPAPAVVPVQRKRK
jgi:hypothetical protein